MTNPQNFLLLFPDQWRGDCLQALGHPVVETPFLNELAAEGTLFTSAYTPSPSCIPARACLATGMTPNSTGRLGYLDRVPWRY
ncbi:MAG: sulfatase-like hydrolase/transferase, partial [Desulfofustis sp.]|nr:sulfatase-like hydrolase/transferase [Desulfofustis sp.]